METPLRPAVFWKHIFFNSEVELSTQGPLGGAPVATLAEAFDAAAKRRKVAGTGESIFIIYRDVAKWWIYEFIEKMIGAVLLGDIAAHDLPLGADPANPETYIVDAAGVVGKLAVNHGSYNINRLASSAADLTTIPEPQLAREPVAGFVVPREMVNHAGNVRWTPHYAFRPGPSLRILSDGLAWMTKNLPNTPIRAAGSRHSWSRVAECPGVTILPGGWTGISTLRPGEALQSAGNTNSNFRVFAGVRIRELNAELQRLGRAIPYLGGFDGQTLGGVLPTGTHGSVLRFGPLADLICSIDLVCFDGKILRIEPASAPLTNPAFLANADPKIELRADDALFDAVRVGLGSCGVIHSLVLRTVPKFWLKEVRTMTTFDDVAARLANDNIYKVFESKERITNKLENQNIPDEIDPPGTVSIAFPGHPKRSFHFELLWNPYNGKTMITTRHWVDAQKRAELQQNEPKEFDNPNARNIFRLFHVDPLPDEYTRPDLVEVLTQFLGGPAIDIIEAKAEHSPKSVPGLIDSAIAGLEDRVGYTQRSYNVFNIGLAANLLPSLSATISIPLKNDLWLRAAAIIANVSRARLDAGIVETAPIALRFVAGSSAHLADPVDVCKFELIFGGSNEIIRRNANDLVLAHFGALRAALGDCARLHWGQLIPLGTYDVADANGELPVVNLYDRYKDWRRLRDGVDPGLRGLTPWLLQILPTVN